MRGRGSSSRPGTTVVPRSELPAGIAPRYTPPNSGSAREFSLLRASTGNAKESIMIKEYHYDHLIRWPKGERACVFLTFDFQGGEDVKPDKNGILNYEMWSQGEYGPHHAIYRLLRILQE